MSRTKEELSKKREGIDFKRKIRRITVWSTDFIRDAFPRRTTRPKATLQTRFLESYNELLSRGTKDV